MNGKTIGIIIVLIALVGGVYYYFDILKKKIVSQAPVPSSQSSSSSKSSTISSMPQQIPSQSSAPSSQSSSSSTTSTTQSSAPSSQSSSSSTTSTISSMPQQIPQFDPIPPEAELVITSASGQVTVIKNPTAQQILEAQQQASAEQTAIIQANCAKLGICGLYTPDLVQLENPGTRVNIRPDYISQAYGLYCSAHPTDKICTSFPSAKEVFVKRTQQQ